LETPNKEAMTASGEEAVSQEKLEKMVWDALKTCYDPEIPVNIVDLGLVYDMHVEAQPGGRHKVGVKMTLTAPGCGMGATIAGDAQQKLLYLSGVEEAEVEIVWDPPWHQSMITSEGRRILGLE
jgi:metal-sulfur cluster biosynthetic enzyme